MSYEENLRSISFDADASIGIYTGVPGQPGSASPNGGKQYCLVKLTGAHQVGLATAAGDVVLGVLQNKPQQPGQAATVGYEGVTNVLSGGVIAAGDSLVSDANGKAVKAGATPSGGRRLIAIKPAAGANELIPAMFV